MENTPEQEIPPLPPPAPASEPRAPWKWLTFVIVGVLILATLTSLFFWAQTNRRRETPKPPIQDSQTSARGNTRPSSEIRTAVLNEHIEANFPTSWIVTEAESKVQGGECRRWTLNDPEGLAVLVLSPVCGFYEALPETVPKGTVEVGPLDSTDVRVARFPDESGVYRYGTVSNATASDIEGTRTVAVFIANIPLSQPPPVVFVRAEFHYSGPEAKLRSSLETADDIIRSLKQQ